MRTGWSIFAGLILLVASFGASAGASRLDVLIAQTVLPNGDVRYSVPVSVGGGAPIQAALDTGSFGLRVLARALDPAQYERTTIERRYGFGGGARFNGVLAKGRISVGGATLDDAVLFQLIESVDCMPQKPKCPAAHLDAKDYGIAGDGYAGAGFDAILGISMRRAPEDAGANNPLPALGDARWLVRLPRPGDTAPGHLVVNPGPEETAGFTMIHLTPQEADGGPATGVPGWKDAAVSGCVSDESGARTYCGRTLLDSGASGVSVETSKVSSVSVWPPGTTGHLRLSGGDQPVDMPFTVGQAMVTKVRVAPAQDGERISAGSLPYLSFEVLYDQKAGLMGLKPRGDR